MKITCNREKLLHAFQTVAAIAPVRSPKPILQNVKLEVTGKSATLMATDLEVGIRYEVAGIEVDAPGAVLLPVDRFGSILRESSDDTFRIESDSAGTTVRGERSQFKLPVENPHEFPAIAQFGESSCYELSARLFRELIRRTIFATDNESSRYALGGVKLEWQDNMLTAVGTDGRRLAKMEGPAQAVGEPPPIGDVTVVPTRAMQLLERALAEDGSEVQLAVRQNDILVKSPRATIYSRLLEGRFPRWRDVFPRREKSLKLDLAVGPALRGRAAGGDRHQRGKPRRRFHVRRRHAGARRPDGRGRPVARRAADRLRRPPISITLDPRFVIDFLKVLEPEKTFTLDLQDGDSAAVCTTDDGYGYVIMPLARDR